ncbi:MAG: hypothetical protein ACFBQW_00380 [Sphingomonadaceae bacterium]
MRRSFLPLFVAAALPLAGCAYGLGGIVDEVFDDDGYGSQDIERIAVNACRAEAQRYGRVDIDDADEIRRGEVRVLGTVEDRYDRRRFSCIYAADRYDYGRGRIVEFNISR